MIRLLIADDEKLEREALAELVQRRFEREVVLEMAENGRKAADTAVLWNADLILMDIEMPGMSGLDAARAVLAQRPSCRVIFVTAYSLFQYAHEAVHLGACDYLLKPVDPDELEASVRRAIRQIQTERKLEELAALVQRQGAQELVMGYPRNMDGTLGPRAEKYAAFARRLEEATGLPVALWDERRTTVDAHRILGEQGVRAKNRKDKIDSVAATLILEGYLARKRLARS